MQVLKKYVPKNGIIAEVGVHEGDSAAWILKHLEPSKLYLIDPWLSRPDRPASLYCHGQAEMNKRHERVCKRFEGDSRVEVVRMKSEEALQNIGTLDCVYIDGDHTYCRVMSDLKLSLDVVKPGGYITGDDYYCEGWWDNGVYRAVNDFVLWEKSRISAAVIQNTYVLKVKDWEARSAEFLKKAA